MSWNETASFTSPENRVRPALVDPSALFVSAEHDRLQRFRSVLAQARSELAVRFRAGEPASVLVRIYADCIDSILISAWQQLGLATHRDVALIAVGGYGRRELHPGSDVDLLILLDDGVASPVSEDRVRRFVTFLWDIGLEVGHSVRTLSECVQQAESDITVVTNLMEARRLAGLDSLFSRMRELTDRNHIWPSREFFEAKWREQVERHHKYHDTAHNLEPNIKEGPGGLRDIQMVGWVAKRHFGADTLHELVTHGFLTEREHELLVLGQSFLWQIRFALHLETGRREDRLLFDHQRELATLLGYEDDDARLAVEHLMKRYYRTIKELSRLNEMLLELFQEAILFVDEGQISPINERFQARNGFLEVTYPGVFTDTPHALLELFLVLEERVELKGVRASTIRLVRDSRHLIDDELRSSPSATAIFMSIIRQPRAVARELRRMHRYGVLGAYLPVFGAIEGQMQYDLFHAYTVDEHSLFVVGNLHGFTAPEGRNEFPLCAEIFKRLPKPELLYLAGLFHDIAKGRGGDHSDLGARDAAEFCARHRLSDYDTRLVSWLVQNHLLMSVTAQRRDITDPEVVNAFAAQVGNQNHLDYLYLLTVADIRGTNPNLWNDWKNTLLRDLYESTQHALARGLENPIGKSELIRASREEARRLLLDGRCDAAALEAFWSHLGEGYFLRADPDEIAWHSRAVLDDGPASTPLVRMRQGRGGTEILVYTPDQSCLFAAIASTLDRLGLSIHDARIFTTENGMALDSFVVLEADGDPISIEEREPEIIHALVKQLRSPHLAGRGSRRRTQRRLKYFSIPTRVSFDQDVANHRTMVEVIVADRPGLLSRIGWAFVDLRVSLENAKIATFGERAEDMFYVTDEAGNPLDEPTCDHLRSKLIEALEPNRPDEAYGL